MVPSPLISPPLFDSASANVARDGQAARDVGPGTVRSAVAEDGRHTVCQLVHGLPVGGAEVLVDRIVRRLAGRYRFVVACLDQVGDLGEQLVAEGIAVVHLARHPGFDWRCVHRLARFAAENNVRLIHAHQYTPFAYAVATRLFGRRPPVLFTEHGRFFPDFPSRKRKWFNRLFTARRDRFVAVGQAVRRALVDNEGFSPARLEIVYNGVDLSSLTSDPRTRKLARNELGVGDDQFLILQVARLDTIKDHGTALRAVARAVGRAPRLRLLIVGDGPERAAIRHEIARQSLEQNVTLLGLRRDVPRLLAAADAFLLTSVSEGIPVTIIEAMAAGVPIVATAVGGVPELVENEVTGLLAPAGAAPELADALVRLSGDQLLRAALADRARHRAIAEFTEDNMVGSYERIYQQMLPRRAPK